MSIHAEADLILKLYDLRREATMRTARDWFFLEFKPQSMEDVNATMFGAHSGHFRMVVTYWEMAAALVNHGAIGLELFTDTNGEHIGVFGKIEPFLPQMRAAYNPKFCASLEKLIDNTPGGREQLAAMRERMKAIQAELSQRQAAAAS